MGPRLKPAMCIRCRRSSCSWPVPWRCREAAANRVFRMDTPGRWILSQWDQPHTLTLVGTARRTCSRSKPDSGGAGYELSTSSTSSRPITTSRLSAELVSRPPERAAGPIRRTALEGRRRIRTPGIAQARHRRRSRSSRTRGRLTCICRMWWTASAPPIPPGTVRSRMAMSNGVPPSSALRKRSRASSPETATSVMKPRDCSISCATSATIASSSMRRTCPPARRISVGRRSTSGATWRVDAGRYTLNVAPSPGVGIDLDRAAVRANDRVA